jgi:5-hydroxyisourate hydrolase
MGKLTTHVLDTSKGVPASNMTIKLYYLDEGKKELIGSFITNKDGRVDHPLLEGSNFHQGRYELVFHVGAYQKNIDKTDTENQFLNLIPIQFFISDNTHYHVPLLYSPYGYSTYRGS